MTAEGFVRNSMCYNLYTGEKSGTMLAEVKWAAAVAGGGEP